MSNIYMRSRVVPGVEFKGSKRFYSPALLESVQVRFYPGQTLELALQVRLKRLGGSYINVLTPFDWREDVVHGDDDYFVEKVGVRVYPGEELEVIANNRATVPTGQNPDDYAYDFQLFANLDGGGDW